MTEPAAPRVRTTLVIFYALAAPPVVGWCLFIVWAIAKNRSESVAIGPLLPSLLPQLLIPLLWIGGMMLLGQARRGRDWVIASAVFAVVLLAVLTTAIAPFLAYVSRG